MIYHDNQRRRDAGLSKVAAENQLPGSPPSRWDISGAGDPSIQGFATDISVNQGQPVSFKINDASGAPYHIEIYRMGYYQGNGARLVASIPSSQTLHQAQDDASADPTTGLLDDGQWAVSASWSVPADATSGIYFAKVIRDDTGGASHIFFVVRDDTDQSEILFKTSDATWQAYNDYGGKSLYDGQSSNGQRAYKVSYNRPFNTRADSPQDFVFNSEYPMVRWLEANGYDVSYFTDVDSDRNGALIKNHQVFLSVGHDEYWSGPQRANVEAARDNVGNPVNLAFFSANEVFWKTRWESSIHGSGADGSGTPYRTLVCYKETHANAVIDPMDPPTWTGTWRDPRFSPPADGGRPENALTGTIFMVNGIRNDAITVPAADGKMRFWRNTRIATLAPGATATLSTGTLGYEWDSDLDNGFRPAGLMDLSSTTLDVSPNYLLLDYGTEFGPGTATHHLTLYRASSGALVFGAGTTQWSWGLDGNHDRGSDAPDVDMQQATVNLLADMGVQPTTLQAGLTAATASTDVTAPTSTIISPAAGASIQNGSAVTITGTATDAGGGMIGGVEVSGDGGMTWHPATGRENWNYTWTPNSLGSVTIKSRAVDDSGNLETPSAGVSVSLAGPISIWSNSTAPVLAANPDTSATEVGVKFRSDVAGYITGIRYYKGSTNTGTHVGSLWTSTGTLLAQVTFTDETASGWQQATFDGPVPIAADTTYVASYHTNTGYYAEDDDYFASRGVDNGPLHALADGVDGPNSVYTYSDSSAFPTNTYRAANYWVDVLFNTTATDTTPPTVTAEMPAPNATGVATNTTVTATFSESVQQGSITFQLKDASNNPVSATVAYNDTTRTATLTPNALLANSTMYTVTVSGAQDIAGNAMTAPVTWSFTTAAPIGPGPYSIWSPSAVPSVATDPDTSATEVGVKFRSDVAGTITGIRYYKGSTNMGTHVGSLWTSTGTLLAQVTFTDETASGWQQATFDGPVPIAADTTYVASYHTNTGHYAEDDYYFTSRGVDNGPLHALADGVDGPNGVYTYSDSSAFPTNTYRAANYWVDVVFSQNVWLHTTASDFGAGTHHGTVVTTSDFGAGTHDRTVVTNISRGEVQLAPGFSDDFNITPLSSAWTNTPWPGATPSVTVSGGILSVAGAQVRSVQAVPSGTPVEGRITIGSATNQQFGLGTDLSATTGNSWAVFSTKGTTGTLYAEVNSAGVVTTQKIGSRPTGYHVYRVQPFSSGFQFYIDGVLKTTISPCEAISKAIPRGTALKIGLASSNGTALIADWVRLASYASSGTFTSSASDAGRTATWGNATWTADLPAETTLIIETSSSTDGGTWSDWSSVGSGGAITSPSGRYLRYRVRITTTNPSQTATLYDISFTWN